MEVGAVKHHLNNEIIHIKKKLTQAKVQIIHKLTRKATLLKAPKKTSEQLKAKLQRKADAAIAEVLLIKKVQAKDLVRFAIAHKGTLQDYLNKPLGENEKVFAKILLHKTLTEKYNSLRERFANMPVEELLMTKKERLKLKKEANEATKKKKEHKGKAVTETLPENHLEGDGHKSIEVDEEEQEDSLLDEALTDEAENDKDVENKSSHEEEQEAQNEKIQTNISDSEIESNPETDNRIDPPVKKQSSKLNLKITPKASPEKLTRKKDIKVKQTIKKAKKKSNAKNSNTDLIKHDLVSAKVVDSFFLTTSGDHYMTLAEPREPDEVKEEHHRGNRQMRRAEMFGKPFKNRPLKRNSDLGNKSFRGSGSSKHEKPIAKNLVDKKDSFNNAKHFSKKDFNSSRSVGNNSTNIDGGKMDIAVEKLHPSWEAKKQKSGIVPFQGKKVVF